MILNGGGLTDEEGRASSDQGERRNKQEDALGEGGFSLARFSSGGEGDGVREQDLAIVEGSHL